MAASTLSTLVSSTVTLGSSAYAVQLTITTEGGVYPRGSGAVGVYSDVAGAGLTNQGVVTGGPGYSVEAPQAAGIYFKARGTVQNSGYIAGGLGTSQSLGSQSGHGGGVGIDLAGGGTLVSSGYLAGGLGGYGKDYGGTGGVGVTLDGTGAVTNAGTIHGGNGGASQYDVGFGGNGIQTGAGVSLTNNGLITAGYGRYGGIGVDLTGAGAITNTGTIIGGGRVLAPDSPSFSGAGIILASGTLVNSGTIAGGSYSGTYADAVGLGAQSTLVIYPSAIFKGGVVADGNTDSLVLAPASGIGTISGLGTQFTGFTNITEEKSANWVLSGPNTLGTTTSLAEQGRGFVSGTLVDSGAVSVAAGALLETIKTGVVELSDLTLSGGTVSASSHGIFVVGENLTGSAAGILLIDNGSMIIGDGKIGGKDTTAIVDNGAITATGGTLTLGSAISGSGSVLIADATLVADNALKIAQISFSPTGNAELLVKNTSPVTSTLSGFGQGDTIDLRDIQASSALFADGTLTLKSSSGHSVGSLTFLGGYSTANFAVASDGHGGTDVKFEASGENGLRDFTQNATYQGATQSTALYTIHFGTTDLSAERFADPHPISMASLLLDHFNH